MIAVTGRPYLATSAALCIATVLLLPLHEVTYGTLMGAYCAYMLLCLISIHAGFSMMEKQERSLLEPSVLHTVMIVSGGIGLVGTTLGMLELLGVTGRLL